MTCKAREGFLVEAPGMDLGGSFGFGVEGVNMVSGRFGVRRVQDMIGVYRVERFRAGSRLKELLSAPWQSVILSESPTFATV